MCNAAVLHCDETSENCTFKGMKASFVKAVKSVGEDGLFVFHFSGHAVLGSETTSGDWHLRIISTTPKAHTSQLVVLNDW